MRSYNCIEIISKGDTLLSKIDGRIIYTFIPENNPKLCQETERFLNLNIPNCNDKTHVNYSPKRFNIKEQKAISIMKKNDEIQTFSSLFNRAFWHSKEFRIMNRTFFSCDYRRDKRIFPILGATIVAQIEHQCIIAREKYKALAVFMSREGQAKRWAKVMAKQLSICSRFNHWKASQVPHLICPDPKALSCWQYLVYRCEENHILSLVSQN